MKRIWILGAATVILGGFLWGEYRVEGLSVPLVLAEENMALLSVGNGMIVGMGNIDSPKARTLSRTLVSFFVSGEVKSIWDIPVGEALTGGDFLIQRVSENMVRSVCAGRAIWWIGDDFSVSEKEDVISAGVSLESDFWVMLKNRLVDFLPIPGEGIICANERVPSEKTVNFALSQKIPLISVKETGGIMLEYLVGEGWSVRTR